MPERTLRLAEAMNATLKFIAACLIYGPLTLVISLPWGLFSSSPFVFADARLIYLDKIVLYCAVYYPPFLASYFILNRLAGASLSFSLPAICVYTTSAICLWHSDKYWARGMEVPYRSFYFALLFIPSLTALAVCAVFNFRKKKV